MHVSVDLSGDWVRTRAGQPAGTLRLPLAILQTAQPFHLEREIQLPAEGLTGLAILMTPLGGRYTVRVNGQEIGGMTSVHPALAPPMRCLVLPVPDGLLHPGANRIEFDAGGITIADPTTAGNLPVGPPLLASQREAATAAQSHERAHRLRYMYAPLNVLAQTLFVIVLMALSVGSPYRRGVRWVALYFVGVVIGYDLLITLDAFAGLSRTFRDLGRPILNFLMGGALTEASLAFLGVAPPVWCRLAYYGCLSGLGLIPGLRTAGVIHLPLLVNLVLLSMAIRRGDRTAMVFLSLLVGYGVWSTLAMPPFNWMSLFTIGQVGFHPVPGFRVFIGLGLILWVLRQSALDRNERERLAGEMGAARTVQRLLIGGSVAGAEAAYLPAREVGGDFYQFAERADGTRLVLVGDVSGKGLEAAMLASVAVGAFRATLSASPAEILTVMNRALISEGRGGFVTCVCARVDAAAIVVANAGHPAGYVDGVEMETLPGLPLGIAAQAEYAESAHGWRAQATFVSDGVVEAASGSGELFGFERTRGISTKPAAEIAEAAKQWGQNDDITVVTVRRADDATAGRGAPTPG